MHIVRTRRHYRSRYCIRFSLVDSIRTVVYAGTKYFKCQHKLILYVWYDAIIGLATVFDPQSFALHIRPGTLVCREMSEQCSWLRYVRERVYFGSSLYASTLHLVIRVYFDTLENASTLDLVYTHQLCI